MRKDEIIQMACDCFGGIIKQEERENFIRFAKLVAEKERERICKQIAALHDSLSLASDPASFRARGQQ